MFGVMISILCSVLLMYLLFCMFLNTPICGGGDVKAIAADVKHRWFWVISIYIGKVISIALILGIFVGIPAITFYMVLFD